MSALRDNLDSMSNGALARLIECSNPYASLLMRGQRTPSLALARKMAAKMGCTVEELLKALGEKRGKRKKGDKRAVVTLRPQVKSKQAAA